MAFDGLENIEFAGAGGRLGECVANELGEGENDGAVGLNCRLGGS